MGQGARHLRVDGLDDDVRCHDHVHTRIDSGLERLQVLVQGLAVISNGRQPEVGVSEGVTMAGKVLGRSAHIVLLHALNLGDAQSADRVGILAHGTDPDDGVVRVGVEVQYGREIHVDAHRAHLGAEDLTLRAGEVHIESGTQRHVARKHSGRWPNTGHKPALLVDRDCEGDTRSILTHSSFLQAVGKAGDLCGVCSVPRPGEVEDAAKVVLLHNLSRGLHAVACPVTCRHRGVIS